MSGHAAVSSLHWGLVSSPFPTWFSLATAWPDASFYVKINFWRYWLFSTPSLQYRFSLTSFSSSGLSSSSVASSLPWAQRPLTCVETASHSRWPESLLNFFSGTLERCNSPPSWCELGDISLPVWRMDPMTLNTAASVVSSHFQHMCSDLVLLGTIWHPKTFACTVCLSLPNAGLKRCLPLVPGILLLF